MILHDVHPDMDRYLKEDCYCIGEIYDHTGFFCWVFNTEDTCKIIVKESDHIAVICQKQILVFDVQGSKIIDALMLNVTEHNIKEVIAYVTGKKDIMSIDDGSSVKDIDSLVDGIMIT